MFTEAVLRHRRGHAVEDPRGFFATYKGGAVLDEPERLEDLLFQGLYPPIHGRRLDPSAWYANYSTTYVERDVRQLTNVRHLSTFVSEWTSSIERWAKIAGKAASPGWIVDGGDTHGPRKGLEVTPWQDIARMVSAIAAD